MAEHEGFDNKTEVQDDNGEKTVNSFGLFVQRLFARNANFYKLCKKLKIRVVTRLRLPEGNSRGGEEKAWNRIRLQVRLEQVNFL